jgi:hypothetical protein
MLGTAPELLQTISEVSLFLLRSCKSCHPAKYRDIADRRELPCVLLLHRRFHASLPQDQRNNDNQACGQRVCVQFQYDATIDYVRVSDAAKLSVFAPRAVASYR